MIAMFDDSGDGEIDFEESVKMMSGKLDGCVSLPVPTCQQHNVTGHISKPTTSSLALSEKGALNPKYLEKRVSKVLEKLVAGYVEIKTRTAYKIVRRVLTLFQNTCVWTIDGFILNI